MATIFGIKTVKAVMLGEDQCPNKACGYGEYFWEELDYQGDDEVQIEQDAWQKVKKYLLEDCVYEYKEIEEEDFNEDKDNEGDYAWYIEEERREVGYKVREVVLDPKSIDVITQAMEEQGLSMTDDVEITVGEDTYVLWRPELGDMEEVFYKN